MRGVSGVGGSGWGGGGEVEWGEGRGRGGGGTRGGKKDGQTKALQVTCEI